MSPTITLRATTRTTQTSDRSRFKSPEYKRTEATRQVGVALGSSTVHRKSWWAVVRSTVGMNCDKAWRTTNGLSLCKAANVKTWSEVTSRWDSRWVNWRQM